MSNANEPLGIAVVSGAGKGWLGINHVKVIRENLLTKKSEDVEWKYSATLSGAWRIAIKNSVQIEDLCANHIVIANKSVPKNLSSDIQVADLNSLVSLIRGTADELVAAWEGYLAANPKKKTLKRPTPLLLPMFKSSRIDAEQVLLELGKAGATSETPDEFRDLICTSRLALYLTECWIDVEAQRTSRKFLELGPKNPRQFPPGWVTKSVGKELEQLELL